MLGSLRTLSDQGIDALIFSYNYASWRIQVDIEVRYLTQARFDSLRGPVFVHHRVAQRHMCEA